MLDANVAAMPVPAKAGLGLKHEHYQTILDTSPDIAWFEITPENYMGAGGAVHRNMQKIRDRYPISVHGIGLSLGSSEGLCQHQLKALKSVIDRYQPSMVSEHLSWSKHGSTILNDLLPIPYTEEALDVFCTNIDRVQNYLQRQILIENPSSYFQLDYSSYSEWEFLSTLAKRSGAKILLDVNNIFVSAHNHGFNAQHFIQNISPDLVQEIHLAGHSTQPLKGGEILIDDHGSKVIPKVWDLYKFALDHLGNRPTLIEWDSNIPSWDTLMEQANIADQIMSESHRNTEPQKVVAPYA